MTRRQLSVLTVAMTAALAIIPLVALAQVEKVTVCHAAGQAGTLQYVELEVPPNEGGFPQGHFTEDGSAEAGHEDDILGACPIDETTTTTSQATTTTTQATTTTAPPTTTTTTDGGTTTTTDDPPSSTTTSTQPSETTVTSTTPTTAPTTTSVGPTTTTLIEPVVADELPYTGTSASLLIGAGIGLLGLGGMLVRKLQDET